MTRTILVRPIILVCVFFLALVVTHRVRAAEPAKVFRVGVHVADISPENYPVLVNAMFTERTATNTVDPLAARCLVLDNGSTRIALAVVDTCMMPRELIDRAKELASQTTGIRIDHMLVSATHTHSAPSAMGCLGSRVDTNYAAFLPAKIAAGIMQAAKNLAPARVGWAVAPDWRHTFCRRWIRRPDRLLADPFGERNVRANMHPGYESPDAIGPSGPVDPDLSLVAFQSLDGRPLALLANYSQHYYGSPLLSSDYYGRFAQHFARLVGATNRATPFVAIMSQGTSGDQMWMDYGAPRHEIGYDAYAAEVAQVAFGAWRNIEYRDWAPLVMREARLTLKFRVPDDARLVWAQRMAEGLQGRLPQTHPEIYALEALYLNARPTAELKIQALRIGDLGIAAIPNEVYALTGLKIKAQSPLQPTFNIELANGAEGYIPTPEQHKLGGYTTWPARTAGLEPQAEPKIVETVLKLLEEVSGKPRRPIVDSNGSYAKAVLDAQPLAYWRLSEFNGPRAADATGHGHEARFEDGVAFHLPGPDGNAAATGHASEPPLVPNAFSGVQINSAPHLAGGRILAGVPNLNARYTIAFWFWNGLSADARGVTGYLFARAAGADSDAAAEVLGIGGTNGPAQNLFFATRHAPKPLAGQTRVRLKTWHFATLARDGGQVAIYLDGKLEVSGELEQPFARAGGLLFFGGSPDNSANFEGKLDEVAVFDRALRADEVARLNEVANKPVH